VKGHQGTDGELLGKDGVVVTAKRTSGSHVQCSSHRVAVGARGVYGMGQNKFKVRVRTSSERGVLGLANTYLGLRMGWRRVQREEKGRA